MPVKLVKINLYKHSQASEISRIISPKRKKYGGKLPKDLTGVTSGYWVVVGDYIAGLNGSKGTWLCRCRCGTERRRAAYQIAKFVSCGCYSAEYNQENNRKFPGNVAKNNLIARYINDARIRKLEWALTRERCEELFSARCHYCGVEPCRVTRVRDYEFTYNGIDRVDNDVGYTEGNTVPCCRMCNFGKSANSVEVFTAWIDRLANYRRGA